jgi:hypothetical protein
MTIHFHIGGHMIALTTDASNYSVAALNAALDKASETQFRVREETLLVLLSKLEKRVLTQKPTDHAPITNDQVETVSFLIYLNRYAMRQCGVLPSDLSRLRRIDRRYSDDAPIMAQTGIVSLLRTIDHPTLKLTPAEKLVVCAELSVMLHEAERSQGARSAQSATKH